MANIINVFGVDCADIDCPDGLLGAAAAQTEDCNDVVLSEVNSIILVHPTEGDLPTNWGNSIADTDFDIDNTDATDVKQKRFFVTGTMAEPEETTVTVNSFQEVIVNRKYSLSVTLHSIPSATYDYFRKIQCGKVKPLLYFTTIGGKIFGSETGIKCSKVSASLILNSGQDGIEQINIVFEWYALNAPDRYTNPLP